MDINSLKKQLQNNGQGHLLQFWDKLTEEDQKLLYNDVTSIDIPEVNKFFKACKADLNSGSEKVDDSLQPIPHDSLGSVTRAGAETLDRYNNLGESYTVYTTGLSKFHGSA